MSSGILLGGQYSLLRPPVSDLSHRRVSSSTSIPTKIPLTPVCIGCLCQTENGEELVCRLNLWWKGHIAASTWMQLYRQAIGTLLDHQRLVRSVGILRL